MNPRYFDELSWRFGEVYEAVVDQIIINLARHFQFYTDTGALPTSWEYQIKKLAEMGQVTKETEKIILSMLDGADESLKQLLEASILDGLKDAEPELRKAAQAGLLYGGANVPPVLNPSQMQAFKAYYAQSADKLNLVNTVMLESTQLAYAATVADIVNKMETAQGVLNVATGKVVTGVSSINQAIRDGVKQMCENGLTGFVDHGGHHWTPEAYVTMDVRTTMANTARQAVWERNEEYGNDLYQVSWHNGARPLCYDWQCRVISRNDVSREVEDGDGNTVRVWAQSETTYGEPAGLFGINCGHYPIPFIPNFSSIRKAAQDAEENAKAYEESQQQRLLERKLRDEKRDLEVLKAQNAPEELIKEQRKRVRDASNNIDEFCEKTGRTRRRDRETAPVSAKFPQMPPDNVNSQFTNIGADVVESKPTINTAANKEELFNAIEKDLGITVSDGVKELDFDMVKGAFEGVKSVTDEYQSIAETLTKSTIAKKGVMSCDGDAVKFNPAYFKEKGKLQSECERLSANGWWVKNQSIGGIGVHETAHAIEWYLDVHNPAYSDPIEQIEAWNKCKEAKAIVSQANKNMKKNAWGQGKLNADMIRTISRYATDTASETLAEAFADVYNNGANASPLSIEIARLTKERYLQFGGK